MSTEEENTEDWIEQIFENDPDPKFLEAIRKAVESGNWYPTYRDENGNVIPCPLDEWNARGGWESLRDYVKKHPEGFLSEAIKEDKA